MNSIKKKFFILLLIFCLAFSFAPIPKAHADGAVDFLTGGAVSLLNAVVSGNLSLLVSATIDPFSTAITCGIGSATGVICSNSENDGVVIMPSIPVVETTGGQCYYQVPVTFYNPRMNVSDKQQITWSNTECSGEEVPTCTERIGVGLYSDSNCSISADPNVYALSSEELRYSQIQINPWYTGCGSVTPRVSFPSDPTFNETNRQVAIYRFTLPTSSPQATLTDWYVNQIPAAVGNGWIGLPFCDSSNNLVQNLNTETDPNACTSVENYKFSTETTPFKIMPYSDLCTGNVCKFMDLTTPNNSYVAYVAKILGSYSYPSAGTLLTRSDKFFNNDNFSSNGDYYWGKNYIDVKFPPYYQGSTPTLGNAIVGPFKTSTPVCPNCENGALNPPACDCMPPNWEWVSDGNGGMVCAVKAPASCTGTLPTNAAVFSGDDTGLTVSTPYANSATNTTAKCEFSCNAGSVWNSTTNTCDADPNYMRGALTPATSTCTITAGHNSCPKSLSWITTNPQGVSAVTSATGTPSPGKSANNDSQTFTIPYNSGQASIFYLYNNAIELARATVTPSCAIGTTWVENENACVINPISVTLNASPSVVTLPASLTTLTWSTTGNPTTCTASGDWSGTKATVGLGLSVTLSTAKTYTYTLTCSKAGTGAATDTVTVTVKPEPATGTCASSHLDQCTAGTKSAVTSSPSKWSWTCTDIGDNPQVHDCSEPKAPGVKEN